MSIPTVALLTLVTWAGGALAIATNAVAQSSVSDSETSHFPLILTDRTPVVTPLSVPSKNSPPLDSRLATPASPTPLQQSLEPVSHSADSLNQPIPTSGPHELIAQDVEGSYVREVKIRFVNNRGEAVDREGNPIQGRMSEEFIRGELQLKTGDRYSQAVVQRDLRQLHQLGLFDNVTVSIENQGTDINVVYNIDERPPRSIGVSGGINDDIGPYVSLGYTDRTVGSPGQRVFGRIQPSFREFEYELQFTSPYIASENRLGYSVRTFRDRRVSEIFDDDIDLPNGDRVREIRMGGSVNVTRPVGDWQGTLGLNYTNISTRERDLQIARRDEEGNPLTWSGAGVDELFTVSLSATRDWRNNPFNPTRGSILSLTTEQSIPIGRGEILMNRLLANYVQYVPLSWIGSGDPDALPELFAFNLQAGTVFGDLPPTEAFRLGGRNSVRGYVSGEVGSARSYFLASGEYRFPIWRDVGGVVFVDFASDLGTGKSVLGKPAVVRDKPGTGVGVGLGLRVRSPIGLIRLDVGVGDRGGVLVILGTGQRF